MNSSRVGVDFGESGSGETKDILTVWPILK